MANVFLSYDHEDVALARPLAAALEKAGHTVWYDRHIHGGAQYSRKIEQALDDADAVVVLWSPRSLESAWVRDEAAEGRDRGKLVPLAVGGVKAPMGFRQFQTIDLGAWSGRGKIPRLPELLNAIEEQAQQSGGKAAPPAETPPVRSAQPRKRIIAAAALVLALALLAGGWAWLTRGGLPVVAVAAADASPRSQAAASDLFVKLGSLAQIGEGKWRLVDAASGANADLVFRTTHAGAPNQPKANLMLLDKNENLLWSREFASPAGGEADLRQQLSLTAGRVLGCALESRAAGGLRADLLKLFLNACAMMTETSMDEPDRIARPLRTIVDAQPRFAPAWSRLINMDLNSIDVAGLNGGDRSASIALLKSDVDRARKVAPDLPELALVELRDLPRTAYEQKLNLLAKAVAKTPDSATLFGYQSQTLQSVGRMNDAVVAARRAAELDPLSPAAATQLIMSLAYANQLDEARQELAAAERLWAGTGALRDAQWSFHLRFGDPRLAKRLAKFRADALDAYLDARADPSPANVQRVLELTRPGSSHLNDGTYGFAIQAMAEFKQNEILLQQIAQTPRTIVESGSYMLFRPAFAELRRDPRFMSLARRIGLADYWLSTNNWPDFCSNPALPYNCKAEAAKYG